MRPDGPMKLEQSLIVCVKQILRLTKSGHLRTMTTMKFSTLSESVKPEAEKALNPETRREILIMVAGVVRQLLREAEESE
jgi:hypothetical protein